MSEYDEVPIDLRGLRTYPLASRASKVSVDDFAKALPAGCSLREFLKSLPRILAGEDMLSVAQAVVAAKRLKRPVIVGFGGHVIKVGVGPVLIELMEQGFITALATTGSGAIHDFEIALVGSTSEDVDAALPGGQFGMAEDTGRLINESINDGAEDCLGIGESLGRTLNRIGPPYAKSSVLHNAYRIRAPVTVHVTLGADITHLHPSARGGAIGEATYRDFKLFCALVRGLNGGGVYLNLGSAVTLPEVFLKAVTAVRNLGDPLKEFTTANLDFIQHYRPLTNVVRRPVAGVGKGYALTGHHELLVPLLASAIIELANE